MKLEWRNNKDFWGGTMLIGIGATAMFIARGYRFGSALRMGPGFFPTILGGILVLFGITIMITGLVRKEKIKERLSGRALILLPVALLLFGILMKVAGFIPALAALVFCSAAAGSEFKLREVLLLTVVLTVLSVALFIWGLGLPYDLIQEF
jgi:putative tricarboxylic transport membrane protein